ncbi:AAA family ATPase [Ancylobacter polymorphus]|uniref:AAA family ATPase n=1 Tax=Ancylobacter polymorphus TaxID=223390 RepID=A0A9E6ZWS1_9HYPH|nr:AAA family ATPase [Ancylobacter polymorphus]UOK71562.1 AAA family ATPase [Ancylobacter polymorphus]
MLTRIDQLKNIGRFTSFKQRADALGQVALVFARNGYGKTTICAVLRSASTQDSAPIGERLHLGNAGLPEAALNFDPTGGVVFQNGSWNRTPPSILIFDGEFIRRNVHTADEVTRDNKRQLLRVIVGATGVRLAETVTDIDAKNTQLNTELRDLERAIRTAHPSISDYSGFANAAIPDDIQLRIDERRRRLLAAQRANDVRTRQNITLWRQLPDLDRVIDLLTDVLDGASDAAERRIADHMAKHGFDSGGRRWLAYGAQRARNTCPYCDQDLGPSTIAAEIKFLFGEAYTTLTASIDAQLSILDGLLTAGKVGSIRAVAEANRVALDFWRQVGDLPVLDELHDTDIERLEAALQPVMTALERKAAAPLTPIQLDADLVRAAREAISIAEIYAGQVLACNHAIEVVRTENAAELTASQMRELQEAVDKRLALQAKAQDPLKTLCERWKSITDERAALASNRSTAQRALTAHVEATATAYEAGINELLEAFGANFRLCQTKASYVGRDPNTEYCIDVNGHVLKAGESGAASKPSFRTVLSAGDKSSLALALFVTQVKQRADLGDCIVVFDDPFNSQDTARQFETASQIRLIAAHARQVVVLSHDPRFLHLIEKDKGTLVVTQHQIVAESDWVASLKIWNVEDEVKADYVRRAERIRAYASTGVHLTGCNGPLLASDIRIFVEEYIDLRFPGRFAPRTLLGAMVDAIDAAGPNDDLHIHRNDLRALNEFSRPEHHRGTTSPDPTQLRAQCKKVVKIIGMY